MIARLVLTDYRNHAALTLDAGAGFVVLTGPNGAGKTNVLEALSLLAPGRGLRRAALPDLARRDGPGGFGVAATLADAGVQLATGSESGRPERRLVRVNGAPAAATALAEWTTLLWLTPAMDRLFVDPAAERRRFLDRLTLALHPGHAGHASRYDAAMRARNRLLVEGGEAGWLGALERQMAEHGAAVHAARTDTVVRLDAALTQRRGQGFAHPALELAGTAVDAATLARDRPRDAAAGRTLAGPHRSDLIVTHVEKRGAAAAASTGEQKALLLEIVLAHAALVAERTGRAPVLLLDEVAAHLDPARRAALFARLAGIGQVWMTGTEEALFAALPTTPTWIRLG